MSSKTVEVSLSFTSVEILTALEAPSAKTDSERTIRQSAMATKLTLNGTSLPAVTQPASVQTLTMTGSAVQVDLTALAGLAMPPTATRTLDLTGAKIIAFHFRPRSSNVGAITVAPGAATPYPLFGTAHPITLQPGQEIGCAFSGVASTLPAVSPTVKRIDFTGTMGDLIDVLIFA